MDMENKDLTLENSAETVTAEELQNPEALATYIVKVLDSKKAKAPPCGKTDCHRGLFRDLHREFPYPDPCPGR